MGEAVVETGEVLGRAYCVGEKTSARNDHGSHVICGGEDRPERHVEPRRTEQATADLDDHQRLFGRGHHTASKGALRQGGETLHLASSRAAEATRSGSRAATRRPSKQMPPRKPR